MKTLLSRFSQLRQYPTAVAGMVIIGLLLLVSIITPMIIPYSEAVRLWRGGEVWRVDTPGREPIAPGRTGHVDLALIALYTFMDSAATDAFYTYRSHRVRAMLSVGF